MLCRCRNAWWETGTAEMIRKKNKKKRWNWLQLIKLQCGEQTEDVQAGSSPAGLAWVQRSWTCVGLAVG